MTEEFRIFGPPGTGKTTRLTEWAQRGAEVFGVSQVSVCSLTRAAVREAAGRDLGLEDESVTTLHARCKRALGAGPPAEERIEDFLREKPGWVDDVPRRIRVPPLEEDESETPPESRLAGRGDLAFNRMVRYRQELRPRERWDKDARDLGEDWLAWCKRNGAMDYTGWLEACQDGGVLPAQQVVLVDEAQDHTPLQLKVLRAWQTQRLALFGDDDQSLYEWSGARPDEFFLPALPDGREQVLEQSHRVPKAVHQVATKICQGISLRRGKVYHPRSEAGEVVCKQVPWVGSPPSADTPGRDEGSPLPADTPEEDRRQYSKDHADALAGTIIPQISQSGTTMILASCAYHLEPILSQLDASRILYHNPYRKANAKWNPLRRPLEALAAFRQGPEGLRRERISLWAGSVAKGTFFKVPKRRLGEVLQGSGMLLPTEVSEIFTEEGEAKARRGDIGELLSSLPNRSLRWEDAAVVLRKGLAAPRVVVGTIHSVKGGEADTVIVLPNLSPAGAREWIVEKDRVLRLIYVAVTRAKERLILLQDPNAQYRVDWGGFV